MVNDGSTDGSAAVLDGLVAVEPRLRVVTHDRNRGYGGALLSGFAAATKQWVFYTDGDGQFDPAELELLVQRASPTTSTWCRATSCGGRTGRCGRSSAGCTTGS